MRFIHTSDWHIGQNFYRYDREDEHNSFFGQLAEIMRREQPDALVVSGDVFHNAAPSNSAQRLFVEGVMLLHDASPQTVIVITAGNHDSGSRLDAERELWLRLGIHVIGSCQRLADGTFDPAQFIIEIPGKGYVIASPYFHTSNYPLASAETTRETRQSDYFGALTDSVADKGLPVVMMAHLAVDGCNTLGHEDEPVGGMLKEKLSELGTGYDYLALGHIHMPQHITDRVYYSGSPIPLSFSEDYEHYVNLVEISAHSAIPTVERLPIKADRHVKTIPPDGAPLDEALAALDDLDDNDGCYVRLLIDQEGIIPADAEDRARKAAEGKACRFCEIHRKPRDTKASVETFGKIIELDDFKSIRPIDIAMRSYQRITNTPMDETLIEMMNTVINQIEGEEQL